jgi:CheY-like chemotaxis protein
VHPRHEDHRVLIVEDDQDCREAVGMVLESEGYQVAYAADGQAALHELRQGFDPCVILLDMMMPVKNGWQFRAEQLSDQQLAALPVVVMSGAGEPTDQAKELGLRDYIKKPVDADRLLTLLQRYCD